MTLQDRGLSPAEIIRLNWPLYLMEAAELAAFMLSACLFTVLLFHPAVTRVHNAWAARSLMGLAMAVTAVLIIKSPWGQKSGAHFNPAITLTFLRLGKIGPVDACCYVVAHFAGGVLGVLLAAALVPKYIAAPSVNYAVTVPGVGGPAAAFAAELCMAALLMATVLLTSSRPKLAPYTTYLVGLLIASYILFLAPVSGFSINPARTFGSAVCAHVFTGLWIYFTAPLLGMFAIGEAFLRLTPAAPPVRPRRRPYLRHRHLTQKV